MFRDIQIIFISMAYWIIFPVQTFIAGVVIRILSLWGYDRSHQAATHMLNMAVKIQQIQDLHPIRKATPDLKGNLFWIRFYNLNKYLIGLNNHIIKWSISPYLSQQEKVDSKLAWLQ